MEKVLNLLTSNLAICIYEGIILGIVFANWLKLRKKKKQSIEVNAIQREKTRDAKLNGILQNELHQQNQEHIFQNNTPYDEEYHDQSKIDGEQKNVVKLQFTVQSELATRKYVIFVQDEITIGKDEKNDLVLNDLDIAKRQCRIFLYQGYLYIQTMDVTFPLVLKRKKNIMKLTQQAVEIRDKDLIEMGSTRIKIEII